MGGVLVARPREAILSRDLIRDQALAIIDEEGLATLTMRRLATRLGVQAASLYTHFANKEAVLDAIADRLAKRIDPTGFADGWQVGLRAWATSYHSAIHWHPNAAPVVAAASRAREDHRAMVDQVHGGLTSNGWPPQHARAVAAAVTFLVLGAAASAAAGDGRPTAPPHDDVTHLIDHASFELALDSLLDGLQRLYDEVRSDSAPIEAGLRRPV